MNRRGFLRGLLAAPMIPVVAPIIAETAAPLAYVEGISGEALISGLAAGSIIADSITVNDIIISGHLTPNALAGAFLVPRPAHQPAMRSCSPNPIAASHFRDDLSPIGSPGGEQPWPVPESYLPTSACDSSLLSVSQRAANAESGAVHKAAPDKAVLGGAA